MAKHQTKVITAAQATKRKRRLPAVWWKAAGLLHGRKGVNALKYQRQTRQAWQQRLNKKAR